jgi:hypothetical protein
MTIEADIPDFREWTTYRLERLQLEYESDLRSVRILYGKRHPDILLYEKWIAAIQQELDRPYRRL